MRKVKSGGGWQAIRYTLKIAQKVGTLKLLKSMWSKNACKTCALGMGGQKGGMKNEAGHWPEFCKKSLQAQLSDMQEGISEGFFKKYSIHDLKNFSSQQLESCGRISFPLYLPKNENYFQPISWDEAFQKISEKLKNTHPQKSFFYFSGRSSNEAGFLLQLFARIYGTNHINNCSYYCHQASGVGLTNTVGVGTATVSFDDLEECDGVFLIGGNPASNHPRMMTSLMRLKNRSGKIIVVNPLLEKGLIKFKVPSNIRSLFFGTSLADEYAQIHIGGDIAFFHGVGKYLIENNLCDENFIKNYSEGFEHFKSQIEKISWEEIENNSGIAIEKIIAIAKIYASSKKVIFAWTMGITHHLHGVANVEAIASLAFLRGMVGKKGAGLLPIRGHSNVQGMGTMGVTPELKETIFKKLTDLGYELPRHKGHDTMGCIEASHRKEMDFAFCLGGNLFGSNPDSNFAEDAMSKISMLVYLNTTLNTGHAHGLGQETLILPVLARDEEREATTQESMFSYVRLSEGGISRHKNLKSEVEIISEIFRRVDLRLSCPMTREARSRLRELASGWASFNSHQDIRKIIAQVIPGFESFVEIDKAKKEFQIKNRILHEPVFFTSSKKAQFKFHSIPKKLCNKENEFQLMTIRSEGQFNTVVFEEEDIYRDQVSRRVILLNSKDMERLGLKDSQSVHVRGPAGVLKNIMVKAFSIKETNAAMYYPEANALISRQVDPNSKTPAFKNILITIEIP